MLGRLRGTIAMNTFSAQDMRSHLGRDSSVPQAYSQDSHSDVAPAPVVRAPSYPIYTGPLPRASTNIREIPESNRGPRSRNKQRHTIPPSVARDITVVRRGLPSSSELIISVSESGLGPEPVSAPSRALPILIGFLLTWMLFLLGVWLM